MSDKLDPIEAFEAEKSAMIATYSHDKEWQEASAKWLDLAFSRRYMYNFTCFGRPIIQLPHDIVAFQEIVWKIKPDLIIETGIAHGGSLILSASLLAVIDYCEAAEAGEILDPAKPNRTVLGIDIDIRAHNRAAIDAHPMRSRIAMIQGSSIAPGVADQVRVRAQGKQRVLVALDSNHTHAHVLEELKLYAPLVTPGSYCIVFDTVIEDMPGDMFPDRPWGKGDNPKTAVWEYLKSHQEFEIDRSIHEKLLITVAPDGYLKRTR
jgi:cephalosporin hydroxylase